ncbi:MAG: GH3 auxin-responsive promoter family protein [Anaerorhabdus sp.]|uniref:GH3 family domain-containing protein n=1 Tax=Anaerorhabdus sp. TaxID=1872524 RepID=UPI003A8A4742
MRFDQRVKQKDYKSLWKEYCGFLDLDIDSMMEIQERLLMEQIGLLNNCELGSRLFNERQINSINEFRKFVPLTTYEDYADILLTHRERALPADVITWIETTWEGGRHPVKTAPYSKAMLDTFRNNTIACLMLASSRGRNDFSVKEYDKALYGVASLPYATGLLPLLLEDEINLDVLPPVKVAQKLSFKERNVLGFKMGMQQGLDVFFALSAVAYYISMALEDASSKKSSSGLKTLLGTNVGMLTRFAKAKYVSKKEHRSLQPKDLFKMKALICAGTDSRYYKDKLENLWGVRPLEIFAGTEPTCIASESWAKNGMYFFPDSCFYEFVPESEMIKRLNDSSYQPKTYLLNELVQDEMYELVITVFKGGAFARYLTGDCYRCVAKEDKENHILLPRFEYVDRIPTIIDIAGFTRISEKSIQDVIDLSKLSIVDWVALKEYDSSLRPYMHLIIELKKSTLGDEASNLILLKNHIRAYFAYFDTDYDDLEKMLGIDPLKVTIVQCDTFAKYKEQYQNSIQKMNAKTYQINDLLSLSSKVREVEECQRL